MNLPLLIATRYFFSKRKNGGINASTIISVISLAGFWVGATALIIILSVFNGFEKLFTDMYANFDADLKIKPSTGKSFLIDTFPVNALLQHNVNTYSFTLEENALLHYQDKQTICTVKAVDKNYFKISLPDTCIASGIKPDITDSVFALVGMQLAYQLGVDPNDQFAPLGVYVPKRGKINLLNPQDAFKRGLLLPSGVFSVQDEIDAKYVILPLQYFNKLLDQPNVASSLEIKVGSNQNVSQIQNQLQQSLGSDYIIQNRFEQHESFYKVMKSEKLISYAILVFIILVAAFNTIGSIYMLVLEKQSNMLTLKSLGITPIQTAKIFYAESLLVGGFGGAAGLLTGCVLVWLQETYGFIKLYTGNSYSFDAYPIHLMKGDVLLVAATILILSFTTGVYPAYKAYKLVKPKG